MTDATFRNAGYAFMIEDNPDQKIKPKRRICTPGAFDSKTFSPAQLKMYIYSKEFSAIYKAFLEFTHILWEATKPTIVLTDNQSVTVFFRTKAIPPGLWNACDYVLQFIFKMAHNCWFSQRIGRFSPHTGTQSHGEDTSQNPGRYPNNTHRSEHIFFGRRRWITIFLDTSRQKRRNRTTNPWKKRGIHIKCETMGSKWGNTPLENKCERISKDRRKHYVVFHKWNQGKCKNTSGAGCRSLLENMKLKLLGQSQNEVLITTNLRYKHCKANEHRINLEDGLLFRKKIGKTGSVRFYQSLIPKQLANEVLRSLHGDFRKHQRTAKTEIAHRENYHFPKTAQLIRQWVISCEQGVKKSRIDRTRARSSMQNTNEHITVPEDAMQNDLVPDKPSFGGYENIVTAMDVFFCFLFDSRHLVRRTEHLLKL